MTGHETKAAALRAAMADQIERDYPHLSAEVLTLIRKVPRHRFIPGTDLETAYVDDAVIIRRDADGCPISSISQPSMVAQMLDMLELQPGMKVLEIGAGTGYCAALVAELVGPEGVVTTIDLDADITDEAARNLDTTGYSRVTVTCGDGALGDPDGAPWDRILVSVGAWEPAPEWIAQLAPDGKLVLPLALRKIQRIVAFVPTAYGLRSTAVLCGGFLSQRGRDAHPRAAVTLNEDVIVEAEGDLGLDAGVLDLLATEPVNIWTGTELPYLGRFDRLIVYMSLRHEGLFTITAPREFLPGALRAWNAIYAIVCGETVAHLKLRALEPTNPKTGNEIGVSAYGLDAVGLAEHLAEVVRSWGRIWELDPVFEVHPNTAHAELEVTEAIVLQKRHSRIRITWPLEALLGSGSARS